MVTHTTRPGIPESVDGQIKPLESRMKSAENYDQPRDVEDGLGQDGGAAVGDQADAAPTETEETQGKDDSKESADAHSPKIIRAPDNPHPRKRDT